MKRWIRLAAVGVAIVAMVAALLILRATENESAPEPPRTFLEDDPDRVQLLDNARSDIARITIERPGGELTIARREESDQFRPVYAHDVRFNTQAVNRIVSSATSVSSRRLIGEVEDHADYGLDEPKAIVSIELSDGTAQRLYIGAETPARDGYYVRRPDDPNVYAVFNTWINPFFSNLDDLRVRSIPQVAFDRLDRIVVQTLGGRTIRAERRAEWDDDPELGFSAFIVTQPYQRRYQLNTNWIEELSETVPALRIGRFVDDAPADLAQYGLAPPRARVEIADQDRKLELIVGSETDGGRFARFPDEPSVFVISGIEPIVSVRPYRTITAFALIVNIDLVDTFVVEAPGERYVGRIEREEIEGEQFPEETYFLDDAEIEEKSFKRLYQWAIGLQFDAEIGSSAGVGAREPLVTITYNLNNGMDPLVVSFEPYNANFATVVRDGEAEFLIARAKLQRMLSAFREASA